VQEHARDIDIPVLTRSAPLPPWVDDDIHMVIAINGAYEVDISFVGPEAARINVD
jgi:hypothetical protein